MRGLMKKGVGVLLVGGLMVSGLGVFNTPDGSLRTAEAAIVKPKKPAGTVTYTKDLGKTKPYGKGKYYPVNVIARGIVNKDGSTVGLSLSLFEDYPSSRYEVYYYKKDAKGKFSYYGKSAMSMFPSGIKKNLPTGTYYAVINSYKAKDLLDVFKEKYTKYSTVTKEFDHKGNI